MFRVLQGGVWFKGCVLSSVLHGTVRFGAVSSNRISYGAVRCESVRLSDIGNSTVRFGGAAIYPTVWFGAVSPFFTAAQLLYTHIHTSDISSSSKLCVHTTRVRS